jgi:hypothetical protein
MPKHTKTATGIVQLAYDTPKPPLVVHIWELVPPDAMVTKIKLEYVKVPREEADAAWQQAVGDALAMAKKRKRHLAAVKANATRKAKKAESEVANG